MINVGLSQNADTRAAVREAVERAVFDGKAGWILAVAGRRHAADAVLAALQDAFPGVPVYGGSCVGALSADRIGYSGSELAITIFDERIGVPEAFIAEPLVSNEFEAGCRLGRWLAEDTDAPGTLLFYDVTREGGGINVGSLLLDGVYSVLPEASGPPIFGAGLIADFPVTQSFLFDGHAVRRNAALALRLPKTFELQGRVMHGCTPVSTLMTVTRTEGACVLELDGEPAVDKLRKFAGTAEGQELALAFSVLLGRRVGDPIMDFSEEDFINRLIIGVDMERGSVSLFEEDIREGDQVQVMVRNNSLLMDSVQRGVTASLAENEKGAFGMYIDCAGRASVFTGSENEESEQVVKLVDGAFPLMGFYVGREIAPFAGRSRPLDWTGVLVVFSLRE